MRKRRLLGLAVALLSAGVIAESQEPLDANAQAKAADDTAFLSFDEWRRVNLERSGQEPGDLGGWPGARKHVDGGHPSQDPDEYNIPFLEEDLELDVFQPSGKRYQDRFNFASLDCAATMVETNQNVKGAHNVLSENKDSYLLNKCSEKDKFLTIELCQDILVDSVAIANYEFFSSMFRRVRISVSDRFPVAPSGWRVLGEFEGRNVRELQVFSIANPQIWARYLRVDFVSHWGNEFYCPVSLVRVHGTTMMEQYRMQQGNSTTAAGERARGAQTSSIASVADPAVATSSACEPPPESQCSTTATRPPKITPSSASRCAPNGTDGASDDDDHDHGHDHDHWRNIPAEICMCENGRPLIMALQVCAPGDRDRNLPTNQNGSPSTTNTSTPPRPAAAPEDNIYQAILKRLGQLEANTTLSFRYIEEQSQHMKALLSNVDKKQSAHIEEFFSGFRDNVTHQLRRLRNGYQRSFSELQEQRAADTAALSARIDALTYDIVVQKRIWVAQTIILLAVLALVAFTRGAEMDYVVPRGWQSAFPASRGTSSPSAWKTESDPLTPRRRHRRSISDSHRVRSLLRTDTAPT